MNGDLETQVRELRGVVEKNNILLRKMNRRETISFWSRMVFILIVLGGSYYSYVKLLSPITQNLYGSLFKLEQTVGSVGNANDQVQDLLETLDFLNTSN